MPSFGPAQNVNISGSNFTDVQGDQHLYNGGASVHNGSVHSAPVFYGPVRNASTFNGDVGTGIEDHGAMFNGDMGAGIEDSRATYAAGKHTGRHDNLPHKPHDGHARPARASVFNGPVRNALTFSGSVNTGIKDSGASYTGWPPDEHTGRDDDQPHKHTVTGRCP